jgi:hypothetical protein
MSTVPPSGAISNDLSITTPAHEEEDDDAPHVAGIAFRSDGMVLLSTAYLEGANLEGRERWEGILLSPIEAGRVLVAVSDGADDGASRVAHHIVFGTREDEDEGGEGSAL